MARREALGRAYDEVFQSTDAEAADPDATRDVALRRRDGALVSITSGKLRLATSSIPIATPIRAAIDALRPAAAARRNQVPEGRSR